MRTDSIFLLLGFTIFALFLYFDPKVSAQVFPFKRQALLYSFLNSTISQGKINPQKYWELREFYSPGYFNFAHDGFDKKTTQNAISITSIPINAGSSISFLKFNSPNFSSLDLLISNDLEINPKTYKAKKIIFQNKHSIIYKDGNSIKIAFVFSETEMNKANGYYDFNGEDKAFLRNKYWLNISSITVY